MMQQQKRSMETTTQPSALRAWLLAARPKTLTAAFIPVILGSALAASDDTFRLPAALLCAAFACGMQIAANFINDLFDFRRGTDRSDRIGPTRACAQGWITPRAMTLGIAVVIALSCLAGLAILLMYGRALPWHGLELLAAGVVCVVFAFLYTTSFSYSGLGDVLVVVFFGLVPVMGTYYVQAGSLTWEAGVLSLISGLSIDTLLMVNNYRDRDQDRLSGKQTFVVRFGEAAGRYAYLGLGLGAALLALSLMPGGKLTLFEFVWAVCSYLFLHYATWRKMVAIGSGEKLNSILGETSRNMLFFSLLLAVAITT